MSTGKLMPGAILLFPELKNEYVGVQMVQLWMRMIHELTIAACSI